jgi:hypothetical protein
MPSKKALAMNDENTISKIVITAADNNAVRNTELNNSCISSRFFMLAMNLVIAYGKPRLAENAIISNVI